MSPVRGLPRRGSVTLAISLALFVGLSLAGGARAAVYWYEDGDIDRANLDGSVFEEDLIPGPLVTVPREDRREVSIEVYGDYVYWVEHLVGIINRAPISGGPTEPFVQTNALVSGLTVTGSGIYWTANTTSWTGARIGHADLDGTNVNPDFLSVYPDELGTVTANESRIFWTGHDNNSAGPIVVGTADPDGTNVNKRLIEFPPKNGQSDVCPSGIVASSSHLYWYDTCRGYGIGRAGVDGSGVNPTFLPPAATGDGPCDLAVNSTDLYWMLCSPEQYPNGNGYIGRSGLDGSAPDPRFLDAGNEPDRLGQMAVDDLTFVKVEKRLTVKKKGTLTCLLGRGAPRCTVTFECAPETDYGDYVHHDANCRVIDPTVVYAPVPTSSVKGKRKKQIKFATARIDIPTGETAKVELKLTAKGRKLIKWATTGENRASKFRGTIHYGSAQSKVKIKLK